MTAAGVEGAGLGPGLTRESAAPTPRPTSPPRSIPSAACWGRGSSPRRRPATSACWAGSVRGPRSRAGRPIRRGKVTRPCGPSASMPWPAPTRGRSPLRAFSARAGNQDPAPGAALSVSRGAVVPAPPLTRCPLVPAVRGEAVSLPGRRSRSGAPEWFSRPRTVAAAPSYLDTELNPHETELNPREAALPSCCRPATVAIMASRDTGTGGYRALPGACERPRRMRPATLRAAIFPRGHWPEGACVIGTRWAAARPERNASILPLLVGRHRHRVLRTG